MNNSFVSKDVAVEVAVVFAKAPYCKLRAGGVLDTKISENGEGFT